MRDFRRVVIFVILNCIIFYMSWMNRNTSVNKNMNRSKAVV